MHKTSAWPLALIYTALIVFASLFPFDGWRAQGIDPLVFLLARLPPPYWSGFDVTVNVVGYAPLGFLLVLGMLRSGGPRGAVGLATLAGGLLSLSMEFLQIYLPRRVPSNMDLLLNIAGTLLGALSAALLERLGAINRWSDFRGRWFVPDASGYFRLRNQHSGKVLGVSNMSTANSVNVVQYDDNGTADHLWRLRAGGGTYFRLQNKNSGKVLGVSNMSTANSAQVVQFDDNGTADHLWRFA